MIINAINIYMHIFCWSSKRWYDWNCIKNVWLFAVSMSTRHSLVKTCVNSIDMENPGITVISCIVQLDLYYSRNITHVVYITHTSSMHTFAIIQNLIVYITSSYVYLSNVHVSLATERAGNIYHSSLLYLYRNVFLLKTKLNNQTEAYIEIK